MRREIVPYTTREAWLAARLLDVTSTDVSALFGCSPYMTGFELWHRKAGNLTDDIEVTERMRWGLRLQDAIARGVIEDNGWEGEADTAYQRVPKLRIGASFDWRVSIDKRPRRHLEIKNVDSQAYREGWLVSYDEDEDDGRIIRSDVEAPPYMELQLQHQMLVAGEDSITLAALVGGNRAIIMHRQADHEVHGAILERVDHFWKSVKAKRPPDPDYYRDSDTIRTLHQNIVGEVISLVDEDRVNVLMREHGALWAQHKAAKEEADARKTEILHIIGDAPGAKGPAGKITRYATSTVDKTTGEKTARVASRITHSKESTNGQA